LDRGRDRSHFEQLNHWQKNCPRNLSKPMPTNSAHRAFITSTPQPNAPSDSPGHWHVSGDVCAFADSERHLGHVLKVESAWVAFDGTHLADDGQYFRVIGTFADPASAKIAVEFASLRMSVSRAS
jgi:hypothetical protein